VGSLWKARLKRAFSMPETGAQAHLITEHLSTEVA
jgi:hypothetical protein